MIARISISELRKYFDPLDGSGWKVPSIDAQEILDIAPSDACPVPWNEMLEAGIPPELNTPEGHRWIHIRRVAYLVQNLSPLDFPILVIENHNDDDIRVYFNDGNHRFAAAIVRGDQNFETKIVASNPDGLEELLPTLEVIESS